MTASRKLAAILAADVVGYSRMMGEDEAGAAALVRERRETVQPIIAAHSGRLFKTMGDGMFIEFPSVVAAVECALAMQKQMAASNEGSLEAQRVLYRIGVHLGDVLVEGEDILGDAVNVATRVEGIAEPGCVCISGAAYEHVRGRVDASFLDLGEKDLKNIDRPLRKALAQHPHHRMAADEVADPHVRHDQDRTRILRVPFSGRASSRDVPRIAVHCKYELRFIHYPSSPA